MCLQTLYLVRKFKHLPLVNLLTSVFNFHMDEQIGIVYLLKDLDMEAET